ncbi:Crotonase, core domain protein, partial [mine drainage metagenome]
MLCPPFSKPLVCAGARRDRGHGVTLLLHCDLVIAAQRSTRLMLSFVSLGLVPEAASTLLLPRLLGQQRAAALLLLGEPLDARTAEAWGLVNRVVDDADLMQEAREVADALAPASRGAQAHQAAAAARSAGPGARAHG